MHRPLHLALGIAVAGVHPPRLEVAAVGAGRNLAIGILPRQPDLDVISLDGAKTHVAGAERDDAMRQVQFLQDFLRRVGHALMLGRRLFRRGDGHQLDLGELVHAGHAARVLAGRARLGAKTRRESSETQRQFRFAQDFIGDIVGQRHFGGRNQPERIFAGGAEQIVFKLGKLAGAEQRGTLHQYRWRNFGVTERSGMGVQHEGAQGAFQFRQIVLQIDKPRARHLGGAFEIHLAQCLADLEMLFRIVDPRRLAERPRRDRHIGAFIGPVRHIGRRDVGDHRQIVTNFLFQLALLGLALLDALFQAGDFAHQRRGARLILLRLGLADQLGGVVAPRLLALQPHQKVAQSLVFFQQIVGDRLRIRHAATLQPAHESGGVITNSLDVVHRILLPARSCHDPCPGSKAPVSAPPGLTNS